MPEDWIASNPILQSCLPVGSNQGLRPRMDQRLVDPPISVVSGTVRGTDPGESEDDMWV
jgi:hypothetical protein